jgi:hypothetical protein
MAKQRAEKSVLRILFSCQKRNTLRLLLKTAEFQSVFPCDKKDDEKRVALTPEAVCLLVESDNEVIVQKGAGLRS